MSDNTEPADDVLDLDAIERDEGTPPFQFRFAGEVYDCASPNSIDARDLKDLIADSERDPAVQLAWMLGEEQWNRLEAVEATFTMEHLKAVSEAWLEHHGLDVPKSGGSPRRSKRRTMR